MHRSPLPTLAANLTLNALIARRLHRVVLIGSFPPRRCGIATFTCDVLGALKAAAPDLDCA